ncbi:type IV pilus modification PilV family protein [Salirhabdus sp. Marseille-P4669]|uniref:type IV pilus modification PilV family protein n=1 Tax=Salirhabdus sp. Marseille-P4669 TaxID=2042310 RepID=UPI0013571896|nr:prepilin-type N-terminal cleavage/methylation domain-containing protein [Salirhabdus sp. Marseille-P4669]
MIKPLKSDKGLTLIEILAAIVILSIILLSFLSFFRLSAKSNQTSEKIIDASYVAQSLMENMLSLSGTPLSKTELDDAAVTTLNNTENTNSNIISNSPLKIEGVSNEFYFELSIKEEEEVDNLFKLLVKIYDNKVNKDLEAQMETKFWLKGNIEDEE